MFADVDRPTPPAVRRMSPDDLAADLGARLPLAGDPEVVVRRS